MRILPLAAATLSVGGFLAWLIRTNPERPAAPAAVAVAEAAPAPDPMPQDGAGSAVPCAIPLPWRIESVDPRFALDPDRAAATARRATAAWEKALGRPLFVEDTVNGLPIRLIYDERQAGSAERKKLEANLAAVDEQLNGESHTIQTRREAYEQRRAAYEEQAAALEQASAAHADSVRTYNISGNGSASELRTAQQRLDRQHGDLLAVGADLEEQRISIRNDTEDLNRRIEEHRQRVESLLKTMAPNAVESGTYRELVQRSAGRNVAVRRAIDVYEFDDPAELWLVLAHELGHALGLGHSKGPGAVMSGAHLRTQKIVADIQPADVALLRERCPAL